MFFLKKFKNKSFDIKEFDSDEKMKYKFLQYKLKNINQGKRRIKNTLSSLRKNIKGKKIPQI